MESEEPLPDPAEVAPVVIGHDLSTKTRSEDVKVYGADSDIGFEGLNLSEDILKALSRCGFQKPSPIQLRSIPLGKLGFDLLLQAKSGTGKTCVFSVIALENVDVSTNCIQALVISPSREIAFQSANVIKTLGHFKEGLKVKVFIGGTAVEHDPRRLTKCHIAVGTPGRLVHLIKDYEMDLSKLRVFILDEADKLLDQSFFSDIQFIFATASKNKQTVVASATYPDGLDDFVMNFMRNPLKIQLDSSSPALLAVEQLGIDVRKVMDFRRGDQQYSKEDELFFCKFELLKKVLRLVTYTQGIVFCSHIFKAQMVYDCLRSNLIDAVLLSGALDQVSRLDSLLRLQKGSCPLMIATDLAARGIDCENLNLVINFDCPSDLATYIHRSGRSGRFGTRGIAITFLSYMGETEALEKFQQQLNLNLNVIEDPEALESLGKLSCESTNVTTFNGDNKVCIEPRQDIVDVYNFSKSLDVHKLAIWHYIFEGVRIDIHEQEVAEFKRTHDYSCSK